MQNAEIFTLTYGSMVRQLLTDLEDVGEVNKQLDRMYVNSIYNMQFSLRSRVQKCLEREQGGARVHGADGFMHHAGVTTLASGS